MSHTEKVTNKRHWPFGSNQGIELKQGKPNAATAYERAMRVRARHDRLIVGGKAHQKKHGLS